MSPVQTALPRGIPPWVALVALALALLDHTLYGLLSARHREEVERIGTGCSGCAARSGSGSETCTLLYGAAATTGMGAGLPRIATASGQWRTAPLHDISFLISEKGPEVGQLKWEQTEFRQPRSLPGRLRTMHGQTPSA